MNAALSFPADALLALKTPEELYSPDFEEAKSEYRTLSSRWHPDKAGGSTAVFQHIKQLYEVALDKLARGEWVQPGLIRFKATTGKDYEIRFARQRSFELGDVFIGRSVVAYALHDKHDDLYRAGCEAIDLLRYPDEKMRQEVSQHMPKVVAKFQTIDRRVLVISRPTGTVCLRDLLQFYGGRAPTVHGAWMVSRLYGIGCYLQVAAGLTHADISPDTIFIDTTGHRAQLLGGWWYAQRFGRPLLGAPRRTMEVGAVTPPRPVAEHRITADLIRATGREILGDLHGSKLLMDKKLPPALVLWLRGVGTGKAVAEFDQWMKVLEQSFGPRKFYPCDVTFDQVYG